MSIHPESKPAKKKASNVPTKCVESTGLAARQIADFSGNPDRSEESRENYRCSDRKNGQEVRELRSKFVITGQKGSLAEFS